MTSHRWQALGLGGLCSVLALTYVVLGIAPAQVTAQSSQFRLPAEPGDRTALPAGLDSSIIHQAVRTAPLEQNHFNGLMLDAVVRNPNVDLTAWLKVLVKLGWRDATSVQNLIADAVRRQDVDALVDPADALLRQDRLFAETTQVMNLAEAYPATWPKVFALLRSHVRWRHRYLEQAGSITNPEVLNGRARTIQALLSSGDRLAGQEVRPFVGALINAGRVAEADTLWRRYTGDRSNLIHDSTFQEVLVNATQQVSAHTLQWTIAQDYGFSADVAPDGLGNGLVALRWDGRGVPVFLSQTTSASPGHQSLRVKVEGDPRIFADRIGFRLRCGSEFAMFEPVRRTSGAELSLKTTSPVACRYPTLEIFGKIQKTTQSFEGALSAIYMSAAVGPAAATDMPGSPAAKSTAALLRAPV